MSKKFTLTEGDKCLVIEGEAHEGIRLQVDFDDVDHETVLKQARRLVRMMNKNSETLTK